MPRSKNYVEIQTKTGQKENFACFWQTVGILMHVQRGYIITSPITGELMKQTVNLNQISLGLNISGNI